MSSLALTRQAPYPVRVQQRRCGKCGKLVSRSAYACRRCGKRQRMRPKTLFLCLALGLIVGMFAVATASAVLPQARPAEMSAALATPVAPAMAPPVGVPQISATDLRIAYSRDAASADRTYRERSLAVTGVVRYIDRNYAGDVVVRLGTGDAFDTVNATFATRNDPALAGVVKGGMVSLLCVGRGALMGAPILASCFLR